MWNVLNDVDYEASYADSYKKYGHVRHWCYSRLDIDRHFADIHNLIDL